MQNLKMLSFISFILVVSSPTSFGIPTGADPVALAADPAASASPPNPVIATEPLPATVAAPAGSGTAPASSDPSGIITEHKNPDGSTITVTRFNGPLPSNVFQSPFQGDMARLHDVYLQNNIYQMQLLQLQAQQAINQALLRNAQQQQLFTGYSRIPSYSSYYSSPLLSPLIGGYYNPFLVGGFGYNPFFPYGGQGVVRQNN